MAFHPQSLGSIPTLMVLRFVDHAAMIKLYYGILQLYNCSRLNKSRVREMKSTVMIEIQVSYTISLLKLIVIIYKMLLLIQITIEATIVP